MSLADLIPGSDSKSGNGIYNPSAALRAQVNLKQPGKITSLGLACDSIVAGTGATDINTACVTNVWKYLCDAVNTEIGGSAKCGRGTFGPFHHNASGAVSGTAGPIMIGSGSGWVRSPSFFDKPFWTSLTHPGSVTPGAGTSYAGCYLACSPDLLGMAVKWFGLILNGTSRGSIRVQFRQGASVVSSGSTGTNRYSIVSGVPDPTSNPGDVKLDVTIDVSTLPYVEMWITGHLNSTAMDPASVWQVCIYRPDNANTPVEVFGCQAHRDEFSSQNTPNPYGGISITDMTCPGKTSNIFMSGSASYGTNGDYNAQAVINRHLLALAKPYNSNPLNPHTMPTLVAMVSNFGRNEINLVEGITSYTPDDMYNRYAKIILPSFAKAGVPFIWIMDLFCSASSVSDGSYFSGDAQRYADKAIAAVNYVAGLKMSKDVGGGATLLLPDQLFGSGGPKSYAWQEMYWDVDRLHFNDNGQKRFAQFIVQAVTNIQSLGVYSQTPTTRTYQPNSLSSVLGLTSVTTVFELDPNKYGSTRGQGNYGVIPNKRTDTSPILLHGLGTLPGDGTGLTSYNTMSQTLMGDASKASYRMDQFGTRAGLIFDNESAGSTSYQLDVTPHFTSGLTQFTIFFILQNLRKTTLSGEQHYLMFGNATDKAANATSVYDSLSNHRILIAGLSGANSGIMYFRVGDVLQPITFGAGYETNPGQMPARVPQLGCLTVDLTSKTVRTCVSPRQLASVGWKSYTLGAASIPAAWQPTNLSIGGLLRTTGTATKNAPCAFGGLWVENGIISDLEYVTKWNEIYAQSGGNFETGLSYADFGGMNWTV